MALSIVAGLVGIAGGIVAIWPKPDPADIAKISAVDVQPHVPLAAFRIRQAAEPHARGTPARRVVLVSATGVAGLALTQESTQPPDQTETASPPASDTDNPTETGTPSPSATATPLPAVPAAPGAVDVLSPSLPLAVAAAPEGKLTAPIVEEMNRQVASSQPGVPAEQTDAADGAKAITDAIGSCPEDRKEQLGPRCVTAIAVVLAAASDENGHALPSAAAARRLVTLSRDLRVTGTGDRRDIVGAVVDFDMEFIGLRNQVTLVTWQLWAEGEIQPAIPAWLGKNAPLKLKPTTEHDTTHQRLFVPLPRASGRYRVVLDAWVNKSRVASGRSKPFM